MQGIWDGRPIGPRIFCLFLLSRIHPVCSLGVLQKGSTSFEVDYGNMFWLTTLIMGTRDASKVALYCWQGAR